MKRRWHRFRAQFHRARPLHPAGSHRSEDWVESFFDFLLLAWLFDRDGC